MDNEYQQQNVDNETQEPQLPGGVNNPSESSRSKFLVFLFSLIPGAGHMYLGAMNRGFQLMLLFFGTLYIGNLVGHPLTDFWPTVIAPIVWFYSFFDSLQTAGRRERQGIVEDRPIPFLQLTANVKWGKTAGWILVILGLLALINNMGFMVPMVATWTRRFLGPAILVGVGLWLLFKERNNGDAALPPVDEEEPDYEEEA